MISGVRDRALTLAAPRHGHPSELSRPPPASIPRASSAPPIAERQQALLGGLGQLGQSYRDLLGAAGVLHLGLGHDPGSAYGCHERSLLLI
jgi:hypothetical protein